MNPQPKLNAGASILVVDDTPANLVLLTRLLQAQGYQARPVPGGELALQAAKKDPPDLVLLDINMPEMNGYEVCARLKRDPALAAIPVIFISAFSDTMDKVKGFELGAVDYVTKPFQFEEIEARVRLHLEVARLRRELERHNANLEQTVARRTRELAEANARLAILDQAKSDFLGLISHELHTPLCGLFGSADLLFGEFAGHPRAAEYVGMFEQSRRRLQTLIDDALLLTAINTAASGGPPPPCPLQEVLEAALGQARILAQDRQVQLGGIPPDLGEVLGLPDFLVRALQSLLETAVKFSRPGAQVRLRRESGQGALILILEADGESIPEAVLPRFFNLLAVSETIIPGGDLGLAPALAERIVSLYGGSVAVENLAPPGIRLTVRLPAPASRNL
jgi:two-component system sensor histidine kinase/response regulator